VDLNNALGQFDAIEANLARLDGVLARYEQLVPSGIVFAAGSAEEVQADDLRAAFVEISGALPAIGGWRIGAELVGLDDIARARLDAEEIGEPEVLIGLGREMGRPAQDVAEYRRRFERMRRELVRERARELMGDIDGLLVSLAGRYERSGEVVADPEWERFKAAFAEIERLLGKAISHRGRWGDLKRHVSFGQATDLADIVEFDWPSVREFIEPALYSELEALPVEIDNLADVVAARPAGNVSIGLAWNRLTSSEFERLVYNLLLHAGGYENVSWGMRTNAPDRGRDIAAYRVNADTLSGVQRSRVIVQCKHWLSKSLGAPDVAAEVATAKLWDDPPVDVLVIATTGRFTADGIAFIEQHNAKRERPVIEYWPESHLESLLAQRSELVTEFGLRS